MNGGKTLLFSDVQDLLKDDPELCQAIDRSRASFGKFRDALACPAARQANFVVLTLEKTTGGLAPRGVLVERVDNDTVLGRVAPNGLRLHPGDETTCSLDQVVDWHYIDTFELEGGELYRALFHRQPKPVRRKIAETAPFLMLWKEEKSAEQADPEFRDLLRDVANLRYDEVARKLAADPSLCHRNSAAPCPGHSEKSPDVGYFPTTVSIQAAEFADARMIQLLHRLGVLREEEHGESLLVCSAARGNVDTTRAMLELGFDVEVTNRCGRTPLGSAVARDHEDAVALLLEHGADCNCVDNLQQSPIFWARSVNVAKRLLAAGARVDLADEEGNTCVDVLIEHGQVEIVNLLLRRGASKDPNMPYGLNEEQTRAKGREVIREYLGSTDPAGLAEFELSCSTDFGCVLPVRLISIERD